MSKSALEFEFGVYCSCCKGNDLDLTNSTKKLHIQVCFSVHDCSRTWSRISQGLPAAFFSIVRRHYITFCVFISEQAKPLFLTFGAFIFYTSSTLTINLITERKPLLTFFSKQPFWGFLPPPSPLLSRSIYSCVALPGAAIKFLAGTSCKRNGLSR